MKHTKTHLRQCLALLCAGGALLATGCQNQLVFTTVTKFGVDISRQANQPPNVTFGYDRAELAIIPVPKGEDANSTKDAYSVIGAFSLDFNHNIFDANSPGLELHQIMATGNAARKAAGIQDFGQALKATQAGGAQAPALAAKPLTK